MVQTEDFVTFDQAMKLKDHGFNWKCIYWYHIKEGHNLGLSSMYDTHNTSEKGILAPTLYQVQKWLMDKKHIVISIRPNDFVNDSGNAEIHYTTDIFGTSKGYLELLHSESGYETYEFALEDGINEALELLKINLVV